jgi:uncharacterized tellurite resistance protein B-like protein
LIEFFRKTFGGSAGGPGEAPLQPAAEEDLTIATCALFLEIASIDNEFSETERASILELIRTEYGLSEQQSEEVARRAAAELEGSIDLWQFTNILNENYSEAERIRVVELLWKVVYADGKLDKHEDYLIHKLAGLLRLTHKQLIAAKLKVIGGS